MASKTKGDDATATTTATTTTTTTTTGSNILTRSKAFKTLVNKVFAACDTSKSGDVSKSEMYVGVLSVHLTLARYAGPAACYPPSREVSDQLFEAADADNSGGISKAEFENILMVLCAQILSRMLVYYAVLILYVPWLAKKAIQTIIDRNIIITSSTIPQGGYFEMAVEQVISTSIFMLAIPLIWNAIDSKSETTIDKINNNNNNNNNKSDTDKKDE